MMLCHLQDYVVYCSQRFPISKIVCGMPAELCLWELCGMVLLITSNIIMNILEFNLHKMKYIMHDVETVSCVFHFPDMWTIVTNVFAYSHHNQWLCGISCSNALEIPLCHYNMIPSQQTVVEGVPQGAMASSHVTMGVDEICMDYNSRYISFNWIFLQDIPLSNWWGKVKEIWLSSTFIMSHELYPNYKDKRVL